MLLHDRRDRPGRLDAAAPAARRRRPRCAAWCATRGGSGTQRVRVQIALGDLTDPPSFRNALRGVDTVVHLAAAIRDQPRGSIEELDGIATWRMVEAAERQGVERFVFFSALGASTHHRTRCLRAKALAEQAVREADLHSIVFAPSIIYAPGDPWLTLLERLALLPVMPVSGPRRAPASSRSGPRTSPTACVAALRGARRERRSAGAATSSPGPETLSHSEIVRTVLRSLRRNRPLLHVPTPIVSRGAAAARGALRAARVRDLGRGRADGGLDALRRAAAPTPRRLGVTPQRDGGGARRRGLAALRARDRLARPARAGAPPTAAPPSSWRGERQQPLLARRAADDLHAERQAVLALVERQRDAGLAGRVEDRREGREQARARERRHRVLGAPCRASRAAAGARRAPA